MKIVKRPTGFWIKPNTPGVDEMGPYAKLSEAQEDRDGVLHFLANGTRRSFFTMDKEVPKCTTPTT